MMHPGSITPSLHHSLTIWVWEGFLLRVFLTDLGHPPLLLREGSASPKPRALGFREREMTPRSPAVDSAIGTSVSLATGLSTAVTLHFFLSAEQRFWKVLSPFTVSHKTRAQISWLLYLSLRACQHSSGFQSDPATAFILFTCSQHSHVFPG